MANLDDIEANCSKWLKIMGLVILVGILLIFPGTVIELWLFPSHGPNIFGAAATDVIPDLVKKAQQKGFGLESKENAEFIPGDVIYREDAKGTSPISVNSIKFVCYDSTVCSSSEDLSIPLTVTDSKVVCNQNIAVAIVVCFKEADSTYIIGIGQTLAGSNGIRSQAERDCGLS